MGRFKTARFSSFDAFKTGGFGRGYRYAMHAARVPSGTFRGGHRWEEAPSFTGETELYGYGGRAPIHGSQKAEQLKLTVVAGAQRHADSEYVETLKKVHDGAIGEVVALNSSYLSSPR